MEAGVIVVMFDVEEEDAGVGGNGDLDFIGDVQAAATLEVFFGDEDLDEGLQFPLLGRGEAVIMRDIALQDVEPGRREGLRAEALTAFGLESEHGQVTEEKIARFGKGSSGPVVCACSLATAERRAIVKNQCIV